ncbi:MAG: hypothetical protein IPM29_07185 [Planctomycetes bacterium]|nr:hypothetical protein [Planctomycetota bacterium]
MSTQTASAARATTAIDEETLEVARAFDAVFGPCVTAGKVAGVEAMEDGSVAVCTFHGGIRTSEREDIGTCSAELQWR